jgi:hypothetical protein
MLLAFGEQRGISWMQRIKESSQNLPATENLYFTESFLGIIIMKIFQPLSIKLQSFHHKRNGVTWDVTPLWLL